MTGSAPGPVPALRRSGFSLRPVPARWFELLTFREDLTLALETLARTQRVELDTRSESTTPVLLPDLQRQLAEYSHLAQRFHAYWPNEELTPADVPASPTETLEQALGRLRSWRSEAEALVRESESLKGEQAELELLQEMLDSLQGRRLALSRWAGSGPTLAAHAFVLPARTLVHQLPPSVITTATQGHDHQFLLAVGPTGEVEGLEQELALLKGRRIPVPAWIPDDAGAAQERLVARLEAIGRRAAGLEQRFAELEEQHALRTALGEIARLEWFVTHASALPVTENFAWITGWTSEQNGDHLQQALDNAGIRALLRFPEAPEGKSPPMVLSNPVWARPFELFARLLGTPSESEADPSRLLVFIVPLLFGYMFGDVGQGMVLLLAGLLLARRYPAMTLFVPAGAMSVLFGFLFGSVFSREDWLPALWVHPLEAPLLLLGAPLLGGMLLLLLGLALNGIEARWRGQGSLWWRLDLPQLLLYLALLFTVATPYAALGAVAAVLWYLLARLFLAKGDLRVLGRASGRLLESTLQLVVNTLSFTRVGAFALAHAGLSAAVVGLADAAGHGLFWAIIMVAGNLLIIILEGLVVSVQVTRLVLFEFFIRFLRGEGRRFTPLAAPNPARKHQEKKRKSP